jgi:uncharacterized protein YecE (DUF72 family)
MKKDLPLLAEFLLLLPKEHRAAFEFRNEAWHSEDVYEELRRHAVALCASEREDGESPHHLVETAPWGYVRLRLESYSDAQLRQWAATLKATGWREIFSYFMHEPTAPDYAGRLMRFFGA